MHSRLALYGAVFVSGPMFGYGLPRMIRLVVPAGTGAAADALGRLLAGELTAHLKRRFVPENAAGAGGSLAVARIAEGPADGGVLGIASASTVVINPHLPASPGPDPMAGLVPIARLADVSLVLVAGSDTGITSLKALADCIDRTDSGLSYSSPGEFSPHHLAIEMLKKAAGLRLVPVADGSGCPISDVLDGSVPIAATDLVSALPHLRSGRLAAIGLLSGTRSRITPRIGCFCERVPGFEAISSWHGLFAPKDTPEAVLDTLAAEVERILWDEGIREQMAAIGLEAAFAGSRRFAMQIAEETERWKRAIAKLPAH